MFFLRRNINLQMKLKFFTVIKKLLLNNLVCLDYSLLTVLMLFCTVYTAFKIIL